EIVGGIPVHYGGQMALMPHLARVLRASGCFVVEDAAHALPAAVHDAATGRWVRVGELADVACFSFYANKTITTGEGGMATTADPALERTIRSLSLHGMSRDAWARFRAGGSWDYAITAAGFKYNMTDVAAALGLRQLARADRFRSRRATIARRYSAALADREEVEVPRERADRRHARAEPPLPRDRRGPRCSVSRWSRVATGSGRPGRAAGARVRPPRPSCCT